MPRLLENHGHMVVVAGNGAQALRTIGEAKLRPDSDGRPDAAYGRLRSHRRDPAAGSKPRARTFRSLP